MDRWLAAVEADRSGRRWPRRSPPNRPEGLGDRCSNIDGVEQVDVPGVGRVCELDAAQTRFGTPATVAGESIATDTNKCALQAAAAQRLLPDVVHRRAVGRAREGVPDRRLRLVASPASSSRRRSRGRPTRTPTARSSTAGGRSARRRSARAAAGRAARSPAGGRRGPARSAANAFTPVSSAETSHSRSACAGSIAYGAHAADARRSGRNRLGDVAVLAVDAAHAVELRRGRGPEQVAAPCSGVLNSALGGLPSSSIQPQRDHLLLGRWRCSGVRIPPGCTANARTPASAAERVELDGEQARWRSSPARTPPTCRSRARTAGRPSGSPSGGGRRDDSATTRAPPPAASAGQSRLASAKWPRWLVANCASQPGPTRVSGQAMIAALLIRRSIDAAGREEALGERRDAVEVGEVELVDLDALDAGERLARGVGRRAGTTTCAPAAASARVVSSPSPQ